MSQPAHSAPRHDPLASVRAEIDRVDLELLRLIAQRIELAGEIAAAKKDALHLFQPAREAFVLGRLTAAGMVDPALVTRLWRELIGAALRAQGVRRIVALSDRPQAMLEALRARFGGSQRLELTGEAGIAAAARTRDAIAVIDVESELWPGIGRQGLEAVDAVPSPGGGVVALAVAARPAPRPPGAWIVAVAPAAHPARPLGSRLSAWPPDVLADGAPVVGHLPGEIA